MSLCPGDNHLFQECLVMNQTAPDKTAPTDFYHSKIL